jgi:hypothetical protein
MKRYVLYHRKNQNHVAEKERVSQDKTVIARKYELDAKNN